MIFRTKSVATLTMKPMATLVSVLFAGALSSSAAFAATAAVQDLGATAVDAPQTVSIVLQLHDVDKLERFIAHTVNPNSDEYRQFLSVEEFTERYAPSDADIQRVKKSLSALGITVNEVYKNHMVIRATGTTAQFNQFFNTQLHNYSEKNTIYSKPNVPVTVPAEISDVVLAVTGLNSKEHAHPRSRQLPAAAAKSSQAAIVNAKLINQSGTTNAPGLFTVQDVASLYNVTPLYNHHFYGQGRTIGIATLATFDPNDAYTYWSSIGLKVNPNRIKQIHIDGGAGTNGADETTLDVEQSGGLAPAAKVVVYDAPNTDSGFMDVFFKAAADNKVDTLSVSWGSPEIAQTPEVMAGQHQAFLELAAQGISVFAAAGDEGAYDINNNQGPFAYPGCSQLLTVDSPASDPYVVAAGGLTLASVLQFQNGTTLTIPKDRPWGWDYLQNYFSPSIYYTYLFPVGGGGGVSLNFDLPKYQKNVPGTQVSAAGQSLVCSAYTPSDLFDAPAGYAGRNVPDVSLNADPDTGYLVYVSGGWLQGYGGTSFVAPQLNGIAALVSQHSHSRLGHLNPQLYARFLQYGYAKNSPFTAITSGDNLYWQATQGYNPASGIGALNVNNLARSFGISDDDWGDDD